jgi:hypothetical protein
MSLQRCGWPECQNQEDPRWGGMCDGHGVSTHAEFYARRDATERRLAERDAVMRNALEHCKHRPHEHNPGPEFTVTRCEVIDRALACAPPSKVKP